MSKKDIRNNFRNSVFERDNWTCQVCGEGPYKSLDFFDFESCQNISELIILDSSKKVTKLKHKKYIGCEKEVVFFSIDTSKINMCDIIMVRYYNLNSMEQYNFKL